MRLRVEDASMLAALTEWLASRGWSLIPVSDREADLVIGWEQDEFAAALQVRADLALWQQTHGDAGTVFIDDGLWPATETPPRASKSV